MAGPSAEPVDGNDAGLRAALAAAELPVEDLTEAGRRFYRFELDGAPVGYGGLEPYGPAVLLRSVVVTAEARGRGLGRAVTEALLRQAAEAGCTDAYLLTTTAQTFFEHLGFRRIDRALAPQTIRSTRQAESICASAAMLTRSIDG